MKSKEREQAELTLGQYRNLIEISPDLIVLVGIDTKIRMVNNAVLKMCGYENKDELLNRSGLDFIVPEEHPRILKSLAKIVAGNSVLNAEHTAVKKDGTRFPIEISASPVKSILGIPSGAILVIRDISERKRIEKEKEVLKQQMEFVLEATKTGLDIIDSDFNLRYVDPGWQKVYGDYTGKKCYEYFAGRKAVCPDCALTQAFQTKKKVVAEEILPREGNRPIEVITMPFQDEHGQWLVAEVNIDISGRKKTEEALKESEEKYRGLYDSLRDGVVMSNMQGDILECNQAYAGMLGYTKEELKKLTYIQLTPKEWHAIETDIVKHKIIKTGYSDLYEKEYIRKDGSVVPAEIRVWLIKDQEGKPKGMWGLVRNISERKKAAEALRKKEEYFRQLSENASDIILLVDKEGIIIYAGSSSKRLLGYAPEELVGRSGFELIHPDDMPRAIVDFGKATLTKDASIHNSFRILRRDKTERIFEGIGRNLLDNPDINGFLMNLNDVTERKRIEQTLVTLNKCFLKFTPDPLKNIGIITETAGEVLKSTCILYNRLEGQMLCTISDWQAPADMPRQDKIEGHICFDTIYSKKEPFIVRHLDKTSYAKTDPNVKRYNLKTYFGFPVRIHGEPVGSLCAVYQEDKEFNPDEVEAMSILAEALGIEEQRRKIGEEVRESEEKYKTLFESSSDAIMTIDPPEWRFTSGNPATIKMFNAKDEATFFSLVPWDLSPQYQPDGQLSSEKAIKMINRAVQEGSNFFEWTHKRYQGEDFQATVLLTRVRIKGKNVVQATVRDISAQKKAEEALRESEEKFRRLFDNATDGMLLADAETKKLSMCNQAICQMLGYSQEEMLRLGVEDIHPKEDLPYVVEAFEKLSREETRTIPNLPMKRKDGSIFYTDLSATVISLANRKQIFGDFRDITERKRLQEELENKIDSLERFQKVMIGRELRIKELKIQVAELEAKLESKS